MKNFGKNSRGPQKFSGLPDYAHRDGRAGNPENFYGTHRVHCAVIFTSGL